MGLGSNTSSVTVALIARSIVTVVVAVVTDREGRVLVQKRPAGKPAAGFWEFPGGKIEQGETPDQALARELEEELGLFFHGPVHWSPPLVLHSPPPRTDDRLYWTCLAAWSGEPQGREGQELHWCSPRELQHISMLPADLPIVASLSLPTRLAITPPQVGDPAHFEQRLGELLRDETVGGVLVRLPEATEDRRIEIVSLCRRLTSERGAILLVHGREDLAMQYRAEGIHHPARVLERLIRLAPGYLHGASVHDRREIERAIAAGMHYLVLGPVLPTSSHPGATTLGWEAFAELVRDVPLPVYAIGGLTLKDEMRARQAGAHGVAVLRGCGWA